MKLQDYRETYYFHSGKASDIARQLSFAGIALIWAFRTSNADGTANLGPDLYYAGMLFVIALGFDLLQYVVAASIWGSFSRIKEKQGTRSTETITAPPWFNWPGLFFFWAKIGTVGYAYVTMFLYLRCQIAITG